MSRGLSPAPSATRRQYEGRRCSSAAIGAAAGEGAPLKENEFRISDVPPGSVLLMGDVAVFNADGQLCATHARCTHRQGPLSEGTLDGSTVTCPWHGSQFNVCTGAAIRDRRRTPRDLPCNRRR